MNGEGGAETDTGFSTPPGAENISDRGVAETRKKVEKRDTREEVLTAFNGALEIFENTPDDQLTPKEQASRELVKTAKEKTLDKDKAFVVNRFKDEDGNVYRQRESIPVDDLIDFLTEKIKSGTLSPDELKQYQDHRSILVRNSKDYYRLPNRTQRNRLNARVRQEYDRVRNDPRLSTGDPQKDWLLASEIITKRRELILPRTIATPTAESEPRNLTDGRDIDNMGDADESNDELTPPPAIVGAAPPDKLWGIPNDEDLPSVLEPGEDEDEVATPAAGPEPRATPNLDTTATTAATPEEIRRDFVFARRDVDIRKRATELAEEQLRSEQRRGSALNPLNWGRKIGLRIGEEHWRQKLIQQIEKSMLANNNSFLSLDMARNAITFKDLFRKDIQRLSVDVNANRTEEQAAGSAKVEQLKTGELIYGQTVREAQGALKTMMMDEIIRPAVTGGIIDQAQVQQRLRDFVNNHQNDPQVQAIFGRDQTQYGKLADYFATDLLETAEVVRKDIAANKYALDQIDRVVKIQLANTDWAAETQASFNYVDKAVAWAERHRLSGILLNPATIGAAASLATLGLTKIPALSKYAGWAVPGVGAMFGAVVAGARRNYDLKVDRVAHQVDRAYNRQIPQGAKRREALEKFAYNTASVGEIINGGGQEMLTGNNRKSLQDLLALDLSNGQTANREEVARRIAEIKTRLDFSAQQNIDLVTFQSREQVEQGRLQLIKALVEAKRKLKDGDAKNPSENPLVNTADLETRFTIDWNKKFTTNREQQDRSFAHFRLRNALGAAAFGGAAGLTAGLVTQEAWAVIGRGVFHQEIGATVLENLAQGRLSGTTGFAVDQTKELFNNPGNLQLNKDVVLAVSPDAPDYAGRAASLLDANGNKILDAHLASNGNIIVSGDFDKLPDSVKALASDPGWENHPTNSLDSNIKEDIKDMVTTGRHDTFIHGDFVIDVNSGPNGQMSMEIPGQPDTRLNGFFHIDPASGEPVLDIDSTFAENKQIDPAHFKDLTDKLAKDGWIINSETVPGEPGLPVKEEFAKHSVNVDHREGYSYDQPGSQENELRLHDSKLGKTVTLDMSHMQLGYQNGLNPNPIDVAQVIKNHEAGWYFTLPSAPQDGIWVSDGVDGNWDGKLLLNPDDADPNHIIQTSQGPIQLGEFSKMVINQDALQKYPDGNLGTEFFSRQDVFNLGENGKYGFIESGRIIKKDGVNVLQHFATIRGLSDAPPPLPTPPHDLYHLTPPGAIEIIPPPPVEIEAPPIIPIPFAPRHPLEPMDNRIIVYYPGGEPTEEEKSFYEQRRSPRLSSNPQGTLNTNEEIDWYLSQQSPEYLQELTRMNNAIGESMTNECRAAICIAAASHQEGNNIYNTLLQYSDQRDAKGNLIDPRKYEVILFLNRPDGNTADNTASEVKRFQREHPEIKVRVIEKVFPVRQPMGTISKYVADMALLRSRQRTNPTKQDLIIATNDADAELISKRYVDAIISGYDNPNKKHIDAALGKIEWDPESFIQYPGFHVANRFIQYIDTALRHSPNKKSIGSSGANFTMKSSIYAAIGGYIHDHDAGQDVDLSKMIKDARRPKNGTLTKDNFPLDYLGPAWIVTNPRRGISYYRQGRPVIRQWSDFGSRQGVRENDWRSRAVTTESIDTLDVEHLQNDINATIDDYGLGVDSDAAKRALGFLNIKYKIENGRIVITDISQLKEDLRKYAAEGRDNVNELKNQRFTGGSTPTRATTTPRPGGPIQNLRTLSGQAAQKARQAATRVQTTVTNRTAPAPAPAPANATLIEQTNNQLISTAGSNSSLETTPIQLSDYLQTLNLPAGAQMRNLNINVVNNNQLQIQGKINAARGTSEFDATLEITPTGQLQVINHNIQPALLHRAFVGQINSRLANLNTEIVNLLNSRIDQSWQVSGFGINNNNLVFNFQKKPTP